MLENIVYEKDYSDEKAMPESPDHALIDLEREISEQAHDGGFFEAYSEAMKSLPKYIVPEDRAAYENLLPRLDKFAKRLGGRIRGVVDYDKWESYIILHLPYFEIVTDEEHELLSDIAKKSHIFDVAGTEDGGVRVYIMINYFNEIGDKENLIQESIAKDDRLVELLVQRRDAEKEIALSHPVIGAFFEDMAAEKGMSAEEFYDMLDDACKKDPNLLDKLFADWNPDFDDEDE